MGIAALALAAAEITGNPMWDPIGSILVGNLLGVVRMEGPPVASQLLMMKLSSIRFWN